MRRILIVATWLFSATGAYAQMTSTLNPLVSTADLASQVQALSPPICTTPPAPDATVATAGTAPPCTPRADAARQTQIPPATAITASDGSFAGPWATTLTAAPTKAIAGIYSGTVPLHCQIATLTTTGFTGKCWAIVTTTLPNLAPALLGLAVSPVANAAAGLTVNVFARQ